MRNLLMRFIAALLTFSVGVGVFLLWGSLQAVEEIPAPRQRPVIPDGWVKVEADGKFSFYIPPDMRPVELSCYLSDFEGSDMLVNQNLFLGYGYGERVSCADLPSHLDSAALQKFSVTVGGKTATLTKEVEGNRSWMHLCFPSMGHGKTKLYLRAMYVDARGANIAMQVFDTIKFK